MPFQQNSLIQIDMYLIFIKVIYDTSSSIIDDANVPILESVSLPETNSESGIQMKIK